MEWTKIKPKHYLFTELTLSNKGCLITLISLTAHLEKIPNEREMFTVVRRKSYTSLTLVMQKCGRSVAEVLRKVIEDCDKVDHKKKISCGTSKTYRDKKKDGDTSHDTTDKIREDKKREEKNIGRFTPPSVEDVCNYCIERNNQVDPEAFISFYESNGWLVGKNKMKDWKAAVITWEKRQNSVPNSKTVLAQPDRYGQADKEYAKKYGDMK